MATIILTGGGSAGHCTPNLALLPYLKKYFDKIYYIGSENGIERDIVTKTDILYFPITCVKLSRKFTLKNLLIPFKLIKGVSEAKKIIKDLKPDVVFSKGGFVSVPTVIAAHREKIPVICHESDLSIGLANKISAKYAETVLTSFPETAEKLKNGKYIGAPIRADLLQENKQNALKYFGFDSKKPVLLVFGGSLGATAINKVLRESLEELLKKYYVLHICGKGNLTDKNKNGYYQVEFTDKMPLFYAAADVCVSRAGSNSIFELAALQKPSLFIPLPKTASRGDQIENAEYFKKRGLSNLLYQEIMTKDTFVNSVDATYKDRKTLTDNLKRLNVNDISPDIAKILYDSALR